MRHIQIFEEHLYEDAMGMEDPAPSDLKYQIFRFFTESGNIFTLRFSNSQGTEAVVSDIYSDDHSESPRKEFSKLHNEGPVLVSGRGRFEPGSDITIQQLFDEYGERIMDGDEPLIITASERVKNIEELE
jgi:hypothetical protein